MTKPPDYGLDELLTRKWVRGWGFADLAAEYGLSYGAIRARIRRHVDLTLLAYDSLEKRFDEAWRKRGMD